MPHPKIGHKLYGTPGLEPGYIVVDATMHFEIRPCLYHIRTFRQKRYSAYGLDISSNRLFGRPRRNRTHVTEVGAQDNTTI